MHMELPELSTFSGMKRFTMNYVKVMQNLRRKGRAAAHIVEEQRHECPSDNGQETWRRAEEEDSQDGSVDFGMELPEGLDVEAS